MYTHATESWWLPLLMTSSAQTVRHKMACFSFFWSLAGNLGHLIWVIKAEQPQRAALPILSACAVFSCVQTVVCLPACGIFNKRTDVDACSCTRGLHGRRKRVCRKLTLGEKYLATQGTRTRVSIAPGLSVGCSTN